MEVHLYDLPAVAEAKRKQKSQLLTPSEASAEAEAAKKSMAEILQSTSWQQVQVYAFDEKTGMKRPLSNEERGEIGPYLTAACSDDKTVIRFADLGLMDGIHIQPAGKYNAKGQLIPNEGLHQSYIIVSDDLTNQATQRYRHDTKRRAALEYNSRKGHGANYMLTDGTVISNISNEGAMVNGKFMPANRCIGLMDADQIVKELIIATSPYIQNEGGLPPQVLERTIQVCMEAAKAEGYNVSLDANNQFVDVNGKARVMKHLNTVLTNN
jgi:hypothetical protein